MKLAFKEWIMNQLATDQINWQALPGDASARSFYRVQVGAHCFIAMFAPPDQKTECFIQIATEWSSVGLPVPKLHSWDANNGFVLMEDLGNTLLSQVLTADTVDDCYRQGLGLIQAIQTKAPLKLPLFDASEVLRELSIFETWFCEQLLSLPVPKTLLNPLYEILIADWIGQPQRVAHRDFHSRNLMLGPNGEMAVIDFQDAVIGPYTYDMVSLLKDCYIDWPIAQVKNWAEMFYRMVGPDVGFEQFWQQMEWVGLQRHLKVLGVFSRLKLRDNKSKYIDDFPRILRYVLAVTERYPAFEAFHQWLLETVMPALSTENIVQVA